MVGCKFHVGLLEAGGALRPRKPWAASVVPYSLQAKSQGDRGLTSHCAALS
jgi:hypothetical protein